MAMYGSGKGKSTFVNGWRSLKLVPDGGGPDNNETNNRKMSKGGKKGTPYDENPTDNIAREKSKSKKRGNKLASDTKYNDNPGQFNNYMKGNIFDTNYSKRHPFNNPESHDKLLRHCIERITLARETRDQFAIRLRTVDLDINGFLKLDDEDKLRLRKNRQGQAPKPVAVNLPLVLAKMDELLTFLMEVFWPNEGMYSAYATKQSQSIANAFALLMNQQASKKQQYHKVARFLFDSLKYNMAVLETMWVKEAGYKLTNDEIARLKKDEVVYEGNEIKVWDLYNFFWDPSVHPVELATKGEYCAQVELVSKFTCQKMGASGWLHGIERFVNNVNDYSVSYYYEKPIVRFDYNSYTGSVDWMRFASGGKYQTIGTGIELITIYIWLNPSEFGLSEDEEYQIWRVIVANHQYIVHAEYMNNAHNTLPVNVTVPYEDGLGLQMKSAAEQIMDYQRFASFLMNVHQEASRKALYGKLIYDPSIINLGDVDDVGGRFPVNPAGYGKDLSKAYINLVDVPKTERTMEDIKNIIDMMELVMPTNILKQVTDLDRATTYQAAATVQGANRRSLKLAKVIEDQAIRPMKFQQAYNVLQYQQDVTLIDQQGNEVQVSASQFRDTQIEFSISSGLENLDKLMMVHLVQEVINSVLQSQQAAQELDVVALLNWWAQMIGSKVDLNQFRKPGPTPQQQQQQQDQEMHNQQIQNQKTENLVALHGANAQMKLQKHDGAGATQPGAGGF